MSAKVTVSESVKGLARLVEQRLAQVQDGAAEQLAIDWRGQIREVGAVDTRRYLNSVEVSREIEAGEGFRVRLIEAPAAAGYSDIVERGRTDISYPGRYPARRAVAKADSEMAALIDEAGHSIERGD